jgi:type I restriction enzyme S subunit
MLEQGWWVTTRRVSFPAHWLYEGEQRLDAGYYADEAFNAQRIVKEGPFKSKPLSDVAPGPFYPGRFKRIYAKTEADGAPFLTPSQMMFFRPTSNVFLASRSEAFESTRTQPGWILITRSGTVGRCVLVGERLARFAITDDAIRVTATKVPSGYLYAYLTSWIGQSLLSKDQYGSAIKHLEPHHVASVPVPLLPEGIQQKLHEQIIEAYMLRDAANALLDDAEAMLYSEVGLPAFDETMVPYLSSTSEPVGVPMQQLRAFTTKASELSERLDASYHVPIARYIVELLRGANYKPIPLAQMVEGIVIPPRFKRIYISAEHGVPFLRPSHLPQMRPYDLGYISKKTDVLDELLLNQGDVLLTTDGTVGRVSLVSKRIAGWAGSNNIARITIGPGTHRNGYLAAFLRSPYGYYQVTKEIYGGVIDHIEVPHIAGVWVPDAPLEIQEEIGRRVVEAYEKKDLAGAIEQAAIRQIESLLTKPIEGDIQPLPQQASFDLEEAARN